MAFCLECRKEVEALVSLATHNGRGSRKCCADCRERIKRFRAETKKRAKSLAKQVASTTIGVTSMA